MKEFEIKAQLDSKGLTKPDGVSKLEAEGDILMENGQDELFPNPPMSSSGNKEEKGREKPDGQGHDIEGRASKAKEPESEIPGAIGGGEPPKEPPKISFAEEPEEDGERESENKEDREERRHIPGLPDLDLLKKIGVEDPDIEEKYRSALAAFLPRSPRPGFYEEERESEKTQGDILRKLAEEIKKAEDQFVLERLLLGIKMEKNEQGEYVFKEVTVSLKDYLNLALRALEQNQLTIKDKDSEAKFKQDAQEMIELIKRLEQNEHIAPEDFEKIKTLAHELIEGGTFEIEVEGEKKEKKKTALKELFLSHEFKRYDLIPRCLEDLVEKIMNFSDEKWRKGGEKELLNEEGEINFANLLAWFRDRMMYYHEFNPDGSINLFQDLHIVTLYRTISFGEMIAFNNYFMRRKNVIKEVTEEVSKETIGYEYVKDKSYENFKNQLIYEVWLFMTSHNNDVEYRTFMGIEEKVPEILAKLYHFNVFTKNQDRLLRILKMPSSSPDDIEDALENEHLQQEGKVGRAIRRALLAYYHIAEISYDPEGGNKNFFEAVLGEEGTEVFYQALALSILKKKFGNGLGGVLKEIEKNIGKKTALSSYQDQISDLFRREGLDVKVELIQKSSKAFAEELVEKIMHEDKKNLNIYLLPKQSQTIIDLVRGALKQTLQKTEGLDQNDASYAEAWAFSMTYWTGISARNDTEAIGFDRWSNLQNTLEYRLRQSRGRGIFGDIFTIYGLRRLGVNFWEGIKATKEGDQKNNQHTLLEILQGGEADSINFDNFTNFEIEGSAMRQFAVDHISNAFKFYDFVLRRHGMDLRKLFTMDVYGNLQFDPREADKIMSQVWHDIRYAFDLPNFLWDHKLRVWYRDSQGRLSFKESTLRDDVVSEQVSGLRVMDRIFRTGEKASRGEKEKIFDPEKGIGRQIFAYLVAMELYGHRQREHPGYQYLRMREIEMIEYYFKKFPIEVGRDKRGNPIMLQGFFNDKEWRQIAAMGHASALRLWTEEVAGAAGGSVTSGAWEMFKKFLGSIISLK